VEELHRRGIGTVMLSGDTPAAAQRVAHEIGITEVYGGLLPHEKLERLESIMEGDNGAAFVGDGINDAPVLARADVGIAMGEYGSDTAVETADVVLTTDSPAKATEAVNIARRTRRAVWQNIVFAFAVKLAFIALGGTGLITMWGAVFGDMGVALLAILNAMRVLRR
jgi:Cd2+/Zn2+-exporting ATPase